MSTVKDLIIEAASRSNLVPRKRTIPADILENGYRLFKGIVQNYNFRNFISFARKATDIEGTTLENEMDLSEAGINNITSVSYKVGINFVNLRYVSYEQFFEEDDTFVYSWKYDVDGKIRLFLKPLFVAAHRDLLVMGNISLEYGLNDELKIPEVYIELFTAALTYKFAVVYPRTDASQVSILKSELDEVETTVKSLMASNKILTRDIGKVSNWASFISGDFIGI